MQRRNTAQRQIVYQSLASLGHASMDSLIEYIRMNEECISLASIYRNISVLLEEKRIKWVQLGQQEVLETVKQQHAHFVCEKCGKIFDIVCPQDDWVKRYAERIPHQIHRYDIALYGECQYCKKQEESKNEVCM